MAASAVDEVDQHQTVIHDDTSQGDHSEHGEDRQIQAHDDVAPDGADDAERESRT